MLLYRVCLRRILLFCLIASNPVAQAVVPALLDNGLSVRSSIDGVRVYNSAYRSQCESVWLPVGVK